MASTSSQSSRALRSSGARCSYCLKPKSADQLARIDNNLLRMIRESGREFTRNAEFCNICITRMRQKYERRTTNAEIARRKAQRPSQSDRSATLSGPIGNHSYGSSRSGGSNRSEQSSRNRTHSGSSGSSGSSNRSDPEDVIMVNSEPIFPLFNHDRTSRESSQRSQPASSQASSQAAPEQNEAQIDFDDDNDASVQNSDDEVRSNANRNSTAAPQERNQRTRTRDLANPPSADELRNMSPDQRAELFTTFKRTRGG